MPRRRKAAVLTPKERAERNIEWIERVCRVPQGPKIGQRIELRGWQKNWIRMIYGNPAGTRRAIISVGRKNAKTTFAAMLLLLHLAGPESQPNARMFSSAQSKEQAGVLFDLAMQMIRASSDLRGCIIIRLNKKELFCPERGTQYNALSADVPTAFGLSPVFLVHDELSQVKGPEGPLYYALESSMGAHAEPLSIIISTQAPTDNDLLSRLIDDARTGADPHIVCMVMEAPKDADPFALASIKMANPAFGDFLNSTEILAQAENARRLPSAEAAYRNLHLNQRVEVNNPFVNKRDWQACGEQPVEDFDQHPAYGGLDLSSSNDLTCLIRVAKVADVWSVKSKFWLPEVGLIERSRRDQVEYYAWHKQGFLETTPGKAIEYDFVAREVINLFETTKIKKIAFDRWNWSFFRAALVRQGMPETAIDDRFVEFGQGFQSMSPALLQLEPLITTGKLRHGNHPVLGMCAHNAVVRMDPAGSRKLDKQKARGRIDGMVALTMAIGVGLGAQPVLPQYKLLVV